MDKTDYMKAYRLSHNEQFKVYRKKWRDTHKDDSEYKIKTAIYHKTYYNRNKALKTNGMVISTWCNGSVILI